MSAALRTAALVAAFCTLGAPAVRADDPVEPHSRHLAEGGPVWIGSPPAAPPRRVVVLAPSLTDVVLALGLGDRLVGVTSVDRRPEVRSLPRVGGFVDPNPEAILGLRPDLVLWVTDGAAAAPVRRLAELARASVRPFPILALDVVSVADVLAAPRVVGEALGAAEAGQRLAAEMAERVERVRAEARGLPRRRVLFVVGRDPLVVAGPGSFPDELLRIAGCSNAVGGERPWPIYPLEKAVAADPDLVVDAAAQEPREGIARLSAVAAVRRGEVIRLSNDDLLRPGPRMIDGLEELLAALRREARR
ncbi:MAG TPA: helical backbone metal receptor [Anaeromyxobacter sp.]|nr:helical backbone metal receptor [Anaeromyxobacter sp.]